MSADDIFCLRAHRPSEALSGMHQRFVSEFGPDRVFVIADHTESTVEWSSTFNVIEMTVERLDELGLYRGHPRIGWLCGDYCYYLAQAVTDFNHLWLIDSDLYFNHASLSDFFDRFEGSHEDFLGVNFCKATESWNWHKHMSALGHTDVYATLFGLTRVSSRAVDVLAEKRRQLSEAFDASPPGLYPNDEGFVATTVVESGLTAKGLEQIAPGAFTYFFHSGVYCLPDILDEAGQGQVIHGALPASDFFDHGRRRFRRLFASNPRFTKAVSDYFGHLSVHHAQELEEIIVKELRAELSETYSDSLGRTTVGEDARDG